MSRVVLGVVTLIALVGVDRVQAAALNLSQQPLFLTNSVGPNLFVTLDNSTSMQMAVVPDASNTDAIRPTRRAKSAAFNSLYYNPAITYPAPYAVSYSDTGGLTRTRLTTSFTSAYVNGYRPGLGSVNLSTDYRVSWSYNPNLVTTDPNVARGNAYGNPGLQNNSPSMLAENPSQDFFSSGTYRGTSSTYGTLTLLNILLGAGFTENVNGAQVSISDASLLQRLLTGAALNGGCSASIANTPTVTYSNVTCTRNVNYGLLGVISSVNYTITANTNVSAAITGVQAYYYLYDTALSTCLPATLQSDGCYRRVLVSPTSGPNGTDERQNFANWYSFYRSRALAAQTATNLALADASENIRLGWQALGTSDSCILVTANANCRGIGNSSPAAYDNRLRPFTGAHRAAFFTWLGDVYYNQSTPLLQAVARVGELLKTTGSESPYAFQPGSSEAPVYGCRASYSLVVTDGIWNSALNSGNVDGTAATFPDGQQYSLQAPFQDGTSSTLADLAFLYWRTDAQPNLDNKVPPYNTVSTGEIQGARTLPPYWNPRNDPATWQHLTGFYVGIGLSSSLVNPAWGGDTFSGGYAGLAAGTTAWPVAGADNSVNQNNVYDLWHAAINSRGEFFSAENASDLITSLGKVVTRITQSTSVGASQTVSPTQVGDTTALFAYVPSFSSADWSGDVIKYQRTATTRTRIWSAAQQLDTRFATGNSAITNRKVYMAKGGALTDFAWANLNADQQASLNKTSGGAIDTYGSRRVDYLRGDRSLEAPGAAPSLRPRSHILGDIVNSSPVVVDVPNSPIALMNAMVGNDTYATFRTKNASRARRIYVGANDGMLHAFDDQGQEVYAFVPSAVIGNLTRLTERSYNGGGHQSFVDNTPVVGDAYIDGWRTVLVGTLRGGGQSIFALDITDPNVPVLLWEKTAADAGYADLGFTYGRPVITRLQSGRWAVIIGNGYNSTNTKGINDIAALLLIDLQKGTVKQLTPPVSGGQPNGLGSPFVADIDGDLIADYAYAGDLQGNLWRFDLFGSYSAETGSVDNSAVSFGRRPLYTAQASSVARGTTNLVQPITASPLVITHPSGTGHLVLFGTGKYLEVNDAVANTSKAMTLYGIWDRQTNGSAAGSTPPLTTADLQQQTLGSDQRISYTSSVGSSVTSTANTVSTTSVSWYDPATAPTGKRGWFLNLSLNGELVINKPQLLSGTLLMSSLIPSTDACTSGVTTYLYALDPYTGGNNRGLFNLGSDSVYGRIQLDGLMGGIVPFLYGSNGGSIGGTYADLSTYGSSCVGANCPDPSPPLPPNPSRRQTWRVITNQD
ncbi:MULTISPECIES: pilus assembly protein [Pseudomonas]|uniref:pilus assembly protein n=1 Tax=Pseudomonas TaxID=286 RepID=UPI00041E9428|nr:MULTISPECIES: PilC/PilY family type IV pilus protein [Pseudomonas]MDU4057513.1 PilC/PilY family type IV pilus protein [Pseudomonas oryzihabitans]HJE67153.1 pilus assembly protein PilY [Pseudomonas oryzihabitans]